ncbi:hypothetical protein [Legionella brunensis]|uniref:Uncharacterized protein n=1 Tax=Legionella brunensis TaxID=29422 RepID=A0A0W0S2Y4_9GAMM|nr:hypothetical protein [Legionella brunensis]KTC77911.1 hypothetical protein Lbru_2804 [Legionella brunensis]
MLLQEFSQDVILRNIDLENYVKRIKFYNFSLGCIGNPPVKKEELDNDAKSINKAILKLALGTYNVQNLDELKKTVERVINHLTTYTYYSDDKNYVYSYVGYPDNTLDSLKEMSAAIQQFQVKHESLSKLTGLRLELFNTLTKINYGGDIYNVRDRFVYAAAWAGDGSYNDFFARRRAARVYVELSEYIKTGKNTSALSHFLEFKKQDARFYLSSDLEKKIEQEIAKNQLINYRNALKNEIGSLFVINKARKEIKLDEVDKILKAIETNEGVSEAIANFKKNPEARAGFQFGFFSIRKSRAEERVDELETAFTESNSQP